MTAMFLSRLALGLVLGGEPAHTLLFDSGTDGYPRYRIPALLVSSNGTLLAICEGRKDGGGLTGNIDIVLKRSIDSGKSWQALQVIADDGENTLGNPCPALDRSNGTIWLAMTRSLGVDTEEEITDQKSQGTSQVWMAHSTDDGLWWSKPRDITDDTKSPAWTWYGTGPGIGIQLRSGRLLIPAYHVVADTKFRASHVLYSDDHGKTWQLGGSAGSNNNECQVAQRRDGTVYLTARTAQGPEQRTIATSSDEGKSFSQSRLDESLYDSHCQACVLAIEGRGPGGMPLWLYAHPAGPGRRDLTIRTSHDEGVTWTGAKLLNRGDSQYSCLALLPDGGVGCLYDWWQDGNYRLRFARCSLDWLP